MTLPPPESSRLTLCGHPEDRKGHCAVRGCGNDWRLCAGCNPDDGGSA